LFELLIRFRLRIYQGKFSLHAFSLMPIPCNCCFALIFTFTAPSIYCFWYAWCFFFEKRFCVILLSKILRIERLAPILLCENHNECRLGDRKYREQHQCRIHCIFTCHTCWCLTNCYSLKSCIYCHRSKKMLL
jgi:hypothetical protein